MLTLRATGRERAPIDAEEVRRALSLLADSDNGIQLHASPSWACQTFSGSDIDAATCWVDDHADADGIYYTLNNISPTLATGAKNADIIRRRWLLIDVDRIKTAENLKQSATAAEHEAARAMSADVAAELSARQWPMPVIIDSGNGYHLIFRIDLENDDAARELCHDFLHTLSRRFDGDRGAIGRECHDARRIAKLPGTWARKGANTTDRPHRMAKIIFAPSPPRVVSRELLSKYIDEFKSEDQSPQSRRPESNGAAARPSKGLKLRADNSDEDGGARAYALAALESECRRMSVAHPGELNDQLFISGAAMGNFVGSNLLSEDEVFDALIRAAAEAGCNNPRKDESCLRRAIKTGKTTPRRPKERDARSGISGESGGANATDEIWEVIVGGEVVAEGTPTEIALANPFHGNSRGKRTFEILSLGELLKRELPDPNWAIPGLLAEGLNLLAGAPKSGKSMLALNLAMTIAAGGQALGNIQVTPGDVLYLSLEDKLRRVKSRAMKMASKIAGSDDRLSIVTEWPRMHQGGIGLLERWVSGRERPTLLIIDVLGKFRPPIRGGGSMYEQDSEHLYAIKSFVDRHSFSALVLHHTRKKKSDDDGSDELDEVSGTMGISGACDGIMKLKRTRKKNDAQVFFTGRDGAEGELALEFSPDTLCWRSLGNADEYLSGQVQKQIIDYMKAFRGRPCFPTDIAGHINSTSHRVRAMLHKLFDKGIVRKQGQGWVYPGPEETDDPNEELF